MGEYNTMAEPVPGYCDVCEHVCRDTYWSEGSYEGGVRFERCRHCGSLLENATPEQVVAEHEELGWDECGDEECAYHNDEYEESREPPEDPDPDRAYDEERDRQILGED